MITLAEAAAATGGRWLAQPLPPETPVQGGAFDTRALGDAEAFFALVGEQGDGHAHLDQLAGSAVKLAVVSRETLPAGFGGAVLLVADTLAALGQLGAAALAKYRPRVVAITGSYGKTTTKEVVAHTLAGARRVLKTEGSLNNEIGVPITLLRLDGTQDTAVLEFSARKPGDIAYLGRIAPPDVAVLLTVGHAHIGVFGSQEAIYRTKGEIFDRLTPEGLALVGAHDPRLAALAAGHRVRSFGLEAGDVRAEAIGYDAEGRQVFTGVQDGTGLPLRAGQPGPHGAEAVLVAWAVARELGLPDALVAERAGVHPAQKGRAVVLAGAGGATLVDDCYNASPETVVNLIGILRHRPEPEKVLVLGPLAELEAGLGESAAQIAAYLGPPLSACVVYDPASSVLAERLRAAADGRTEVRHVAVQSELVAALRALDAPGRVIGIKGARSAHMERFIEALRGTDVTCERHPCGLLAYCTDCERLTRR